MPRSAPPVSEGPPSRGAPVVVIGAGIVGVATALWLQRQGARVTLVDRADPGEAASYGNGGVLARSSVVPVNVPGIARAAPRMMLDRNGPLFLQRRHLPRMAPWLASYLRHATPTQAGHVAGALAPLLLDSLAEHQTLSAGTGAEHHVVPSDYIYLYPTSAAFARDRFGWELRRRNGIAWEEIAGRKAVAALDPSLAPAFDFAVRLADHGRIADPGAYVAALAGHVVRCGGRLVRAEAEGVVVDGGRVAGVRAGGETLACDAAVVTAGAWSGPLARSLGVRVPLESERGYHLELWEPSAMPRLPAMLAAAKLVVTPMAGRIRLAGLVEFGGLAAPASEAPVALLRRAAARYLPGVRWAETRAWMGHRPALADSLPVIGAVPGVAGAFLGFGHHHVGLTAAPATGRILAQLVAGQQPNIDLAPYAPDRFQ
jgi:D-amino-acid dehydrogenase